MANASDNSAADQLAYRAIWISDTHLGTHGAKADRLLDFLKRYDATTLYLVGDIVDGWRLRRQWYWPESHEAVLDYLRTLSARGTKLVYLPGNHDEDMRNFLGETFDGMAILDETVHETADGKRLLVLHGDQFDVVVKYAKWLAHLGDKAYVFLLWFNRYFEFGRRRIRASARWSLSAYLKGKVKTAVEYLSRYETVLVRIARDRRVDGIVCGHIHRAEIRDLNGVLYCNDGDWVESCTAMVEHHDGELEIVRWHADHLESIGTKAAA